MPFIAKVMQQVVVVVADDRPQNSWKILRIDRQIFWGELTADDRLPYIVLKLVYVPDEAALVAALVTVFILDKSHEVSSLKCYW